MEISYKGVTLTVSKSGKVTGRLAGLESINRQGLLIDGYSDSQGDLQAYVARRFKEIFIEVPETKGGPGSGNWGHAGRPGKRGGSATWEFSRKTLETLGVNPTAVYGHYDGSDESKRVMLDVLVNRHKVNRIFAKVESLRAPYSPRIKELMGKGDIQAVRELVEERDKKLKPIIDKLVKTTRQMTSRSKSNRWGNSDGLPSMTFSSLLSETEVEMITDSMRRLAAHADLSDLTVSISRSTGRAVANKGAIKVLPVSSGDVYHEMGHIIEDSRPEVRKAVFKFFEERIGNGKPMRISSSQEVKKQLFKSSYGDNETFYPSGKFYTPYAGKDYVSYSGRYATELVSMFTEQYVTNGAFEIALHDPEHWMLGFDAIKGNIK